MTAKADLVNDNGMKLNRYCLTTDKVINCSVYMGTKLTGPKGSRKLRFPNYVTTAQDGGEVVSLTHRPPLPPGNAPGTYFC